MLHSKFGAFELLLFQGCHAKGISKGLPHQALQQPTLVNAVARSLDRRTAGSQVQRAAGTKQTIQAPALIQTGIQQHRSPQGDSCP